MERLRSARLRVLRRESASYGHSLILASPHVGPTSSNAFHARRCVQLKAGSCRPLCYGRFGQPRSPFGLDRLCRVPAAKYSLIRKSVAMFVHFNASQWQAAFAQLKFPPKPLLLHCFRKTTEEDLILMQMCRFQVRTNRIS